MSQIQVANRRKIIGLPTDMATNAIALLEKPGGQKAKSLSEIIVATDVIRI